MSSSTTVPARVSFLHGLPHGSRWAVTPTRSRARRPTSPARLPFGSKLSLADVVAIRERLAAGEYRKALAVEYGVSHWTVRDIARGKSWAWASGLESVPPARAYSPRRRAVRPSKQRYQPRVGRPD